MKIFSIFVAFLENMNFKNLIILLQKLFHPIVYHLASESGLPSELVPRKIIINQILVRLYQ